MGFDLHMGWDLCTILYEYLNHGFLIIQQSNFHCHVTCDPCHTWRDDLLGVGLLSERFCLQGGCAALRSNSA